MNMAKQKQKKTFEQALAELEEIVEEIEKGKVPLEESIEKYAEGMKLVKQCRGILEAAEKKIQVLSREEEGLLRQTGELEEDGGEAGEDE